MASEERLPSKGALLREAGETAEKLKTLARRISASKTLPASKEEEKSWFHQLVGDLEKICRTRKRLKKAAEAEAATTTTLFSTNFSMDITMTTMSETKTAVMNLENDDSSEAVLPGGSGSGVGGVTRCRDDVRKKVSQNAIYCVRVLYQFVGKLGGGSGSGGGSCSKVSGSNGGGHRL